MPKSKKNRENINPKSPPQGISIPKEEQWRLVKESGVLNAAPLSTSKSTPLTEDESVGGLAEEILDAMMFIIPINFLLLMMEILIHYQYGRHPTLKALVDRTLQSAPILSIFIFYTTRYKQHRRTQFLLFLLGSFVGSRLIYLLNHGSWLVNMRQCPPLVTIWVYAIVQLELGPAVLNLIVVGIFIWWKGLNLRQ